MSRKISRKRMLRIRRRQRMIKSLIVPITCIGLVIALICSTLYLTSADEDSSAKTETKKEHKTCKEALELVTNINSRPMYKKVTRTNRLSFRVTQTQTNSDSNSNNTTETVDVTIYYSEESEPETESQPVSESLEYITQECETIPSQEETQVCETVQSIEETQTYETVSNLEETQVYETSQCIEESQESECSEDYASDVYLLAQILYAEAGGCDAAEMARVGQVVLNRINTDYKEFRSCVDIKTTLYKSGSYPKTVEKIENGLIPSQEALQVAEGLLNGTIQSNIGEDVFWQTGFEPEWILELEVVYVSEWGHYYSRLAE